MSGYDSSMTARRERSVEDKKPELEGQLQPPQDEEGQETGQPERASNWITDMYDKMNIPVRTLDIALIVLGVLIILLFVFGNKIQLGI